MNRDIARRLDSLKRPTIHRYGPTGKPACGATGRVNLSTTGALVNCPGCDRTPDRAAQEAAVKAAAARFRRRRERTERWQELERRGRLKHQRRQLTSRELDFMLASNHLRTTLSVGNRINRAIGKIAHYRGMVIWTEADADFAAERIRWHSELLDDLIAHGMSLRA